jgi:hypothetical protein
MPHFESKIEQGVENALNEIPLLFIQPVRRLGEKEQKVDI